MQNLNFLETELLDILFRGRNKNYGAYTLRKNYASRVKQAMSITVLSVMLIYGVQFLIPKTVEPNQKISCFFDSPEIKLIDNVEIVPTGLPPAPSFVDPGKTVPTDIVDHKIVNVKPIEKDEKKIVTNPITNTNPGTRTTTNPDIAGKGGDGSSTISSGSSGTQGPVVPTPAKTVAPKTFDYVDAAEVMPEYPGGEEAMLSYLRSNMKYPKIASQIGVEGTVFVQFVVNTKGEITKLKVLRGIGSGCDYEASRVIKSMPAWKPGWQGGQKVNVSFVLPVKFEL